MVLDEGYAPAAMPDLYTFVAHQDLAFANPFSPETIDRACGLLGSECLTPRSQSGVESPVKVAGSKVIDFGAGFCELPIRLAERFGCEVVAVELGARMAQAARTRIRSRLLDCSPPVARGGVTVHEGDAGRFRVQIPDHSFDCAICIGSSHALGGFQNTVDVLSRLTKPGGCILVGEGFWERDPAPADLVGTDVRFDEFTPLASLFDALRAAGTRPIWSVSATQREWDEYEWAHHRAIEAFAALYPGDPESRKLLTRGRLWRDMYVRSLRGLLGFALVLARKEPSGSLI